MYLRRSILSCTLLLCACGDATHETTATSNPLTSGGTDSSSTAGVTGDPGGELPETTGGGPATTGSGTLTGDASGNFLDPTDGANGLCDVWLQDCPEGQKCAAFADDGSEHWNANKCVPVVQNPALPGEPCTLEDGVASGIDDCDKGSFCWYMDYSTLEGTCIAQCTGSADAPMCPDDRRCDISNNGTLLLCLEACDPLVLSCPNGQLCFSSGEGSFICDLDNSGDGGAYGDPCAFVNSCNYGLFCAYTEEVPGCDNGSGCCSEFCDLTVMPSTCTGAPMQTCEPWFDPANVPPGFENVGYCTILL